MLSAAGIIVGAGLILLVGALRWHRQLDRSLARARTGRRLEGPLPSVTVVRPVRGRDVGAEENLRAALDTGYPGEVETLFVFDDESDPGLPIARAVVAEHVRLRRPGRAEVIIAGAPPPDRTGKLNAMAVGAARARGELIGFGDSDTRPDRGLLAAVVESLLTTERAGCAFAPVVVDRPVEQAGDALYALLQNALYAPLAAHAARRDHTLPFIMGQLMVFTREALDAIGGVDCARGQLVDDMYLGRRLRAAGYHNVMARAPLRIATGGMSFAEFLPVFRRWMMFSRNGLPFTFTWRQWLTGVRFFGALALVVGAVLTGNVLVAPVPLAALFTVGASQLSLQRRAGGQPIPLRLAWTGWGVLGIAPLVMISNLFRRDVDWRGRSYSVDAAAALAAPRRPRSFPWHRTAGHHA